MASGTEQTRLRFKDKVVIITGGCNGIGKGCVDVFHENGAKVVIFDIDGETGISLTAESPDNLDFIKCDVSKEDQVKASIEKVVTKYGKLDCIINNAGIYAHPKPIDEITLDDFQKVININLYGVFLMSKYAMPHLRKTKGNIVNMSSVGAEVGAIAAPTYNATKGAIISLTKTLAIDEARYGVRVNTVSPGMVWTSMAEEYYAKTEDKTQLEQNVKLCLLNRYGTPKEIGEACLYLASEGTYCTGVDLKVNAGINVGVGPRIFNF